MALAAEFDISGSGVHDLGGNVTIADIVGHISTMPLMVDIIEPTVPERVARLGWIAWGSDMSMESVVRTFYTDARWIDFRDFDMSLPNLPQSIARYIRWELKPFGEGHLMVFSF